ncbi:MAG: ATP-grasp domain-containing protein [Clostridia bacterium]|nr:ATP-grasp domain-containing protein [Clostridia bacterium]
MNIGLFYGGRSFEREISVITAIQLMDYFPKEYELIPIYMKGGMALSLKEPRFFRSYEEEKGKIVTFVKGGVKIGRKRIKLDCALLATHGGEGENGVLQSVLEYYEIPFTSSDHFSSALTMDKKVTKNILDEAGIKTAKELYSPIFPCIIKPRRLGSSIGIRVARTDEEYMEAVNFAKTYDDVLVEEYLENAVEFNCAAIKREGEITTSAVEKPNKSGAILDYDDKYLVDRGRELPAAIGEELTARIKETTKKVYELFDCFGVVRVDFLYYSGELYVNEINSIPGSLAFYLFENDGLTYESLLRSLVEEGIKRGIVKAPEYDSGILKKYAEGRFGGKTRK